MKKPSLCQALRGFSRGLPAPAPFARRLRTAILISLSALSTATGQFTDNLVAYWNFDGTAANHPAALGGAAYNGILKDNAAIIQTPRAGTGSLFLDGAGDYMDVTAMLDVNQPWSVSAWFWPVTTPSGATRSFVFETSGGFAMSFGLREGTPASATGLQLYTDPAQGADPNAIVQLGDAEAASNWHHIFIAFIPPTPAAPGFVVGYLDGMQSYTLTLASGSTLVAADGFHLGTYRLANDRWFHGLIDEVAVWNRSFSPAEAMEIFTMGRQNESIIPKSYRLILAPNLNDRGSVSGRGSYDAGNIIPISATASPGYAFAGWEGDFAGRPASFAHTVTANATATARFDPDVLDTDGDGLSNYEEIVLHQTSPVAADTDGDRIPDNVEIRTTFTNPLASDAALISFAGRKLGASPHSGAIALEGPSLVQDSAGSPASLKLGLYGTADQKNWHRIDLAAPGVSIIPSANGWDVTIPAPSSAVDSYILLGQKP